MFEDQTNEMVAGFYFAGAGVGDWRSALEPLRQVMRLQRAVLICIGPLSCSQHLVAEAAGGVAHGDPCLFCPDDPPAKPYAPLVNLLPGHWLVCNGDRCGHRAVGVCSWLDPGQVVSEGCLKYYKLLDSDEGSVLLAVWPIAQGSAASDEPDIARCQFLLTHLAQAVELFLRTREARDLGASALEVLNRLCQPTLLVDQDSRIHFANEAARGYLADSLHLEDRQGVLCCTDPGSDERLSASLRVALPGCSPEPKAGQVQEHKRVIRLPPADHRPPVSLCVIPLSPPDGSAPHLSMALLLSHEPAARARLDVRMVEETFGLTPAEARAAIGLVQGRSLAELAKASGLSVHTLRSQVQSAMAKTDTHRQADLVALILRSFQTEEGLQLHCS